MIDVAILMCGFPDTIPFGSNRVNTKASVNSSSGTPCCKPSDTAMAKQLVIDRNAAPSLCMSMKISPRAPSSYSPVRRYTLWLPIRAFCVYPARRSGSRRRGGRLLGRLGQGLKLRGVGHAVQGLAQLRPVAVQRVGLEHQAPRELV